MSKKFKFKKPTVALSGEAFKEPTPRDCLRFQIPPGEADKWEVVARFPNGRASHLRQKGEPDGFLR